MKACLVVLVTVPSTDVGREVARSLLERKLAACVNILPGVVSLYNWEGELCSDEEALLIIKTAAPAFDRLSETVRNLHPYEVPEIIALPIVTGSADYLDWINEVVED